MNKETCCSCEHFRQHYGLDDSRLYRLSCGHCTRAVGKRKRPEDKACPKYAPGRDVTHSFVAQGYLTKVLLHYVLSLPLLPEIGEAPEE